MPPVSKPVAYFLDKSYSLSSIWGNSSKLRTYCSSSLVRYSLEANASSCGGAGEKCAQAWAFGCLCFVLQNVQCPQWTRKILRLPSV